MSSTTTTVTPTVNHAEAARIATAIRADLDALSSGHFISKEALHAPRRRTGTKANRLLAAATACELFPELVHEPSHALIQYERIIVPLCAICIAQEKGESEPILIGRGPDKWAGRIRAQGPWDEENDIVSLEGPEAIPMPVKISSEESLAPFFNFLASGGSFESRGDRMVQLEPYYEEPYIEFEKGVLYRDRRMDLCKMVVGPQHIVTLLAALRTNPFVKHFLLGNNLIGPNGALALASYLKDFPNRIETWYLAGCCIDAPSFKLFVDHIVHSSVCHSIWLKRNCLTSAAADDMAKMIVRMKALRVLDIEQTEFGDKGAERLFTLLHKHLSTDPQSLETLYLNADGIGQNACLALSDYLSHPNCNLKNLYVGCNPIGDKGALALAPGLAKNTSLQRLMLKSIGVKTAGAQAIFTALRDHPKLFTLDVGHAYTTRDLKGARYNFIQDGALESLKEMLENLRTLRYFNLGISAMSRSALDELKPIVRESNLIYYQASSIYRTAFKSADGIRARLEENVRALYGNDVSYSQFLQGPFRFLISEEDVRYIDSVYRNRDAQKAKRGEMELKKKWDDEDETLAQVSLVYD